MSSLSEADRARIARNREEALKKAAARKAREQGGPCTSTGSSSVQPANYGQPSTSAINSGSSIPKSLLQKQAASSSSTTTSSAPISSFFQPSTGAGSRLTLPVSPAASTSKPIGSPSPYRPPVMARLPKSQISAQFKICGAERFKVVFYPFHSSVVNALKTIPSRFYDDKDRTWSMNLSDIAATENALNRLTDVEVTITEPIADHILRLLSEDRKEAVPSDLSVLIDPTLIEKLFPYQKAGVRFALEHRGRVLIADEMGLGKSVQALAVARYYKAEWPLLIVCPSSVKSAWKHQLNTFLPVIQKITVIDKGSDPMPDSRTSNTVVIMSYDQMALKHDQLKKLGYQVIILDESHSLKDMKAKRTKVALDLAKRATRVVLLSGTPALSRPAELFSQIKLVNDRLFPNFQQFAIRYCDGKQGRFCFESKGCTNSEELSAILSRRIMIRRLKADVLKDLPDKRREVVYLSGDSIDSRMDSLQKAKLAFEDHNKGANSGGSNESLLEYFSLTGIVKAAAVCTHILDNYFYPDAPQRKVLIFAHHQIVLDTIQVEVQKRNLRSIRIDGSTPGKDRGALCKAFQEDPGILVAVLSMTAAGVGITLTAASVVVFAELHWNPGSLMQAEDRAHRVGQKDSVFVQYLVARNTADDVIWPMIQRKLDVLGQVKLSSDTFRDADKTHLECTNGEKGITEYFKENAPKKARLDDWD